MKKLFIFTILLTSVFVSGAFAQWKDGGKLNSWTSQTISRRNDNSTETTYLKEIRTAKNKGFDRVVFEFTGDTPRYQIEYIKPPITGTADTEIKVKGKFFISVNLQSLPYPDDEKLGKVNMTGDWLKTSAVSEIREAEWFEGVRWYVIGLKAKKLYRVQQLKNPTRLVIDFKQ